MKHYRLLGALAAFAMAGALPHSGLAAHQPDSIDQPAEDLGPGFASGYAKVNGTTLHYVRGGTGPALILVHGFPQDWYAFHEIMPRLAERFTVIAVDLRGVGRSAPSWENYSISVLVEDLHQLADALGLNAVYIAGQDNGGMLAYAFARAHPEDTRGAMIIDVPLPGVDPWEAIKTDPTLWHFGFHQAKDLPEILIPGQQYAYFRRFFDRFSRDPDAISDEEVRRYVDAYAGLERLKAGLGFYRDAYPSSEVQNRSHPASDCPPIVLVGGEHSMGPAYPVTASALAAIGCRKVLVEVVRNSGHWVADEQPEALTVLIEKHAKPTD